MLSPAISEGRNNMKNHIEWIDHNNRIQARGGSPDTLRRLYQHLVQHGVTSVNLWLDGATLVDNVNPATKTALR
jgi:hypothetical protein